MDNTKYKDKDITTNLLISLKHMKLLYNTFTQETSNKKLFKDINELYEEISDMQQQLFELMKQKKWYVMQAEEKTKISKAYTKFANCLEQMNAS